MPDEMKIYKAGRYVRNTADYNAGPETLRDCAKALANLRKQMEEMEDPEALAASRAAEAHYSSILRMATLSKTPKAAAKELNKEIEKAAKVDKSLAKLRSNDFQHIREELYRFYENSVEEVVESSNKADLVEWLEQMLEYADDLADAVAAYEEKQKPFEALPIKLTKNNRKKDDPVKASIDWSRLLEEGFK